MESISHATTARFVNETLTVADFSRQIVTKFVQKIERYEVLVLQDTEPEPLHKLRVGMRRLRIVLQVLEPLIVWPDGFTNRSIGKLANVLGAVRDLDVMGEFLHSIEPEIPDREQQILTKVAKSLARCRHQAFAKMEKCLARDYRSLVAASQIWLDCPQYRHQHVAAQLIVDILPDLLLPLMGEFFRQDGWGVMTTELDDSPAILHDLRKCTKRLRYQTECFAPYFATDVQQFLLPLEASQECLGQMQDAAVLGDFIGQKVGQDIAKKLPILSDRLEQRTQQAWQDWQPIRLQLCDRVWRQALRRAILC